MKRSREFLKRVIFLPRHGENNPQNSNPRKARDATTKPPKKYCKNEHVPDADKLFEYLVKAHNDTALVVDILEDCSEFDGMSINQIMGWFNTQTNFNVFQHTTDMKLSRVVVYTSAKLCFARDCQNESCRYLHLCKYFITGNCHNEDCTFNHILRCKHNDKLLSEAGITSERYDEKHIQTILRCSLMKCCDEYNQKNSCSDRSNGTCSHLHICSLFIQGKCELQNSCTYGHDITTDACMETQKYYRMNCTPPETAKKMILPYSSKSSISMYNKEAFICEANLRKQCPRGYRCPDHHFHLPYLWQVELDECQWKDLINDKCMIEKAYCDATMSAIQISEKEVCTEI